MLGEQLITSDRVALVELVKNAYDADATLVTVDFRSFDSSFRATQASSIVVRDDGTGMSESVVRDAWLNPATPSKRNLKSSMPRTATGRFLQGEKGIGRFAAFKLGRQILLSTRATGSPSETTVAVDVSGLDDDAEESSTLFLDELPIQIETSEPVSYREPGAHGTEIVVLSLRSEWGVEAIDAAYQDLEKMQPIMWQQDNAAKASDFRVEFLRDGELHVPTSARIELRNLLDAAVLRVEAGRYDSENSLVSFNLNGSDVDLPLDGASLRGNWVYKSTFQNASNQWRAPECGSFEFTFYVFDLASGASAKHKLNDAEKTFVKSHRVYLYRDDVRVYPYGDPDDDWLRVDAIRGNRSASSFFSNDQLLGYIKITQAGNPKLRDKTNREGLLEFGHATSDFVGLIQSVLSYLRSGEYKRYTETKRRERESALRRSSDLDRRLSELVASPKLDDETKSKIKRLGKSLEAERELAQRQIERTQDLAGVGLSIESASHDLIASSRESLRMATEVRDELVREGMSGSAAHLVTVGLVQRLEFIVERFRDVEGMFVSSRQKITTVDVSQVARRVRSIYASLHARMDIEMEIEPSDRLSVQTTEGAVMIALVNLIDNATYWLGLVDRPHRKILIESSPPHELLVSDNGPGVAESDLDFIFEAFYTGKGEAGKGLGLYIAREIGARNGFTVELAGDDRSVLGGATFVLRFDGESE
jgi:signal transduction histidine kinase